MNIDLNKQQIQTIYQVIQQMNWNGAQIELAFELKKIFKEAVDELSVEKKEDKEQ